MPESAPLYSYYKIPKEVYNTLILQFSVTLAFLFAFYFVIPGIDREPFNLMLLIMGPMIILALLHLILYYNSPHLEIYNEGLRRQKYFLWPKPFFRTHRFVPFSSIAAIQLKDIEKSMMVEQAPYLSLEMKEGGEERVYIWSDDIAEIKKIITDHVHNFTDARKERPEELPEIAEEPEEEIPEKTNMVHIQCPACGEEISFREDVKPWVLKCPKCSYEPERPAIRWLYLLDHNDEVFDRCPKCENYTQISGQNMKRHVQFTCNNCSYKFIIDKRGGMDT